MQHTQATVLPVPDSNGLIIGGGQNPRKLVVEEDGSHVVEMAVECEEASPSLIRPDFDLVIVTTRYKERLCFVEVDAADRPIMLLKSIDQCAHPVIPELDGGGVEGDEDPWSRGSMPDQFSEYYRSRRGGTQLPFRMKRDSFGPGRLRLKLRGVSSRSRS